MTQTLITERLVLRQPKGEDMDAVCDFFLSPRASGVGGPYVAATAWKQFAAEVGHWQIYGFGMWAVTLHGDDSILGLVGPWFPPHWPEREIGWMMFAGSEGKGIAFEAAHAARTHAQDVLGWDTIVSYIDADNSRSIRLAEKLGAVLDPDATPPKYDDPCLVYRHPAPQVRA